MSVMSIDYAIVKTNQLRRATLASGFTSKVSDSITQYDRTLDYTESLTITGVAHAAIFIEGTASVVLTINNVAAAAVVVTNNLLSLPFACTVAITNNTADTTVNVRGVVAN